MKVQLRRSRILFSLILVSIVFIIGHLVVTRNRNSRSTTIIAAQHQLDTSGIPFLIHTDSCTILDLHPFHESVSSFVEEVIPPVVCHETFVTAEGRQLLMKNNIYNVDVSCCYRWIKRIGQDPNDYGADADDLTELGADCHPIQPGHPILINDSFIKVECQQPGNFGARLWSTIQSDYFAFVQPPKLLPAPVQQKVARWNLERQTHGGDGGSSYKSPPNILILGVDSISRLHSVRTLPRTRELLSDNGFVEMVGYSRVGVNTLPNVMAILTGQRMFDNETFPCKLARSRKFDDCPFIWKEFGDNGYLTTFIEDYDTYGTFNYWDIGFVEQPTDFYTHPLMTTARNAGGVLDQCLHGGLNDVNFILNYLQQVLALSKAEGYPTFSFAWLVGPAHDNMNLLKNYDTSFHAFFNSLLTDSSYDLENTVVFFISDHGFHMGPFRETFYGFYEDNLPMMFVRLPSSLKSQYPEWETNLQANSHKVTSPFDFRETLLHLLELSKPAPAAEAETNSIESNQRKRTDHLSTQSPLQAQSWLKSEIPGSRTCSHAGVKSQDCMCGVNGALELGQDSDAKLTRLSQIVLDHINNAILHDVIESSTCAKLSLQRNLYGRTYTPPDDKNNSMTKSSRSKSYLIGFQVAPSEGTFEAYIREYENGTAIIEGDIYRLNMYRGQSDCVKATALERYCYCTELLGLINWFRFYH